MKLRRVLNRIRAIIDKKRIKYLLASFFVVVLLANTLFLLLYVNENKNDLIFNRFVKILLPSYRVAREIAKTGANILYLHKMKRNVGIPQYRLVIDKNDLKTLNENLPSSISDEIFAGNIHLDEKYRKTVPAEFVYGNKKYKVKVRYRGDNPNHWTRPKRSWQIKFDKDNLFEGLETIKLIIPSDRGYIAEYLNNYRAEKLGLFVPEAKYVNLVINRKDYGVYYQIEDWSRQFLEKNELPSDSNLYVTNDFKLIPQKEKSAFDSLEFWKKQVSDKVFDFNNFSEIDLLLSLFDRDDFSEVIPNIIDMENFYRWQIVSDLARSDHQGNRGNMRLHFNNSKGKFQFIPWDVEISANSIDNIDNLLINKILSHSPYMFERNKLLWQYVSDKKNLKDDLKFYDKTYKKLKPAFYADWKKHDSNFTFDKKIEEIRNQFIENFNNTRELFKEDNSIAIIRYNNLEQLIRIDFEVNNFSGIKLNSISFPLKEYVRASLFFDTDDNKIMDWKDTFISQSVQKEDGIIEFDKLNTLFYDNKNYTIFIELNGLSSKEDFDIDELKLNIENAITGKKVEIEDIKFIDNTTFSYFEKINLTPAEFVIENNLFYFNGENLVLPRGNYNIWKDIIVPKENLLRIEPGAVLNFAPNISLISYSPIESVGTLSQPIIFRTLYSRPWGVVGIANAGEEKSIFKHTTFSNGSDAYINGILFSGMLSAYHSSIMISDSTIENSHGDDGVNVKYAVADILNNRFIGNSVDAIDIDYSSGTIENNFFVDNGNDSIDISGSGILISDNYINKSGDKCISIGEKSKKPIVFNNVLDGCKIGIETKDGSTPKIINNVIVNNEIGLNAYRKKEIFTDGGMPKVYNSIIWGNKEQVKDDEFSETEMYYSIIEGGHEGEGNISIDPLISNINIGRASANNAFQNSGNIDMISDIIESILGLKPDTIPIGLIRDVNIR